MGTLFSQTERKYGHVNLDDAARIAEMARQLKVNSGVALTTSEAIEIIRIAEYSRRTDVMVDDGDRWDEQIAGVGEILQAISHSIKEAHDD